MRRILRVVFCLALSGCSWHYTVNAPLAGPADPAHGYRYANVAFDDNSDSLLLTTAA